MPSLPQKQKSRKPRVEKNEQQMDLFAAEPSWTIYVLCDPRVTDPVQRVRYVGVTTRDVAKRLQGHLREARRGNSKTYKARWIRTLIAENIIPLIEIVDCGVGDRPWDRNEVAWIRHFRDLGLCTVALKITEI